MVTVGMLDIKHPEKNLKAYPFACVAKAEGINFFYFIPSSVNLESKTIQGYFYENGCWVVKSTTFPDVIYNSNSQAKAEEDQIIIEALRFLIPFTSYPVGNKIKVFEMLGKSDTFLPYLPETKEIENVNSIIDYINQRRNIILKPRHGRKGSGIIFITCKEDMYELTQENKTSQISKSELGTIIEELIPKSYIAQQYIRSMNKAGNVYDFRLHVQKDGTGEWKICTIYPRIAPHDSIKSNISSGGATLYLAPFLEQEFNEDYYNMKRYLEVFSISIAKEMDHIYGVAFDELGIDIGLDENNKIWLYEINWHPGVPPTFYLELSVVKTSLEYCCYLANKFLYQDNPLRAFRPVIAITGSAGKTTTKSMIASVLRERLNVFESKDNCNTSENTRNHVNEITPFHQAAVLEYAMGHAGVIARHCNYIKPHLSIVTNIGPSHISNFNNDIKEIAKAKSEIIKGMDQDGILIMNGDDPNSKFLEIEQFKGKIIKVGISKDCQFQATNIQYEMNGISFDIEIKGEKLNAFLPALGNHNLYNALFAIAAGVQVGLTPAEILNGLKKYRNPKGRLELYHFDDEITVIDDTCHATYEAMKSAIEVLYQQAKQNRKKIAVLGTMPELGTKVTEYHREIGKLLYEKEVNILITFGTNTVHFRKGAMEAGFPPENIFNFYNYEKLNQFLKEIVCSNTVFLFKGARRINLSEVAEQFINNLKNQSGST
ncbi:MAG: YheC/YheD family protein [Herbinix sp.]|nr:YheC/YheD family protein [Herbinix sp.]